MHRMDRMGLSCQRRLVARMVDRPRGGRMGGLGFLMSFLMSAFTSDCQAK